MMDIFGKMMFHETWKDFLEHKIEKQHTTKSDADNMASFIDEKKYMHVLEKIHQSDYDIPIPYKKEINKEGVMKKRVVYSYPSDINMILKMIAYLLYEYDDYFASNCYAFRRSYGVKDAIMKIRTIHGISEKYCLKADISNYFNSIDTMLLLQKLFFLKEKDRRLYDFFEKLLTADIAKCGNAVIHEKRGAMAGTPVSPFFANVYLTDVDRYFEEQGILYFRYSDDILLFADTRERLAEYKDELFEQIKKHHLKLNKEKVSICAPGEKWDFLGLSYVNGRIDLSEHTKVKIKGKIKRKAHALRRWQKRKGLSGEQAAKGFIKAMNHKFFASDTGTEFTWSRWFFPNLTTDAGLKEIDSYMQQYIRYCVTGKHAKSNYKITYDMMKKWGYRNLVHEYYSKIRI